MLKRQIALANPTLSNNLSLKSIETTRNKNISSCFIKYDDEPSSLSIDPFDTIDASIEKYISLITNKSYEDTLLFWKLNENVLPLLYFSGNKIMLKIPPF